MADAKITVGVEGVDQVKKAFDDLISNAQKVGGAVAGASKDTEKLGKAAGTAQKFWGDFSKSVTSDLKTVATSALATVTAVQTISFAQAITSAKALDDSFARFAAGSGRTIGSVRDETRKLSRETNTSEAAVISWSKSIGKVTYSTKEAMASYKAFTNEALASNQDLADQGGLAAVLSNSMGVSGGDTQGFLDSFRGMSDAAGNAGGFNAAKDQLEALGGAMSELSFKTEQSKKDFIAFQLTIGKGQTPQQAQRVQGSLLANLQSHGEGLARQFGRDNVYDENGRINGDAVPALVSKIRKDLTQRYGKNARRVAMQNFGGETGAAIFNFDEKAFAATAGASAKGSGAAGDYYGSDEGKRAGNDLKRDQAKQDAARNTFGIQDMLGDFGANHPYLAGAIGLGASSLGKAGLTAGWGALTGGGGAATGTGVTATGIGTSGGMGLAGGLGLAGAGILGSLGALAYATGDMNENMGKITGDTADQLSGRRAGLARAVVMGVERGGGGGIEGVENALGPATLGAVKSDPVLASLLQQFESQSATISGLPDDIAKAVADALKGSPINVNVLNQTGAPIHGVSNVQNKASRQ